MQFAQCSPCPTEEVQRLLLDEARLRPSEGKRYDAYERNVS
jgi:hypothetical protein